MSYAPLGGGRTSPHTETIELTTKNDGRIAYGYAPPEGPLHDGDFKRGDANAYWTHSKAVDSWPIQTQQIAALTPLRGIILVFDIVLASSPLLFIGVTFAHSPLAHVDLNSSGPQGRKIGRQST